MPHLAFQDKKSPKKAVFRDFESRFCDKFARLKENDVFDYLIFFINLPIFCMKITDFTMYCSKASELKLAVSWNKMA